MRDVEWSGPWPRGRVDFTGQDNATADFDVYSCSRKGKIFDVRIDYHKGVIRCDCEDADYRRERRTAPIGPYQGVGCKHIRLVCLLLETVGVFNNEES